MAASCSVEQTVAVDLGSLLDAREGAMVTLVASETRLAVHKAVLSARCPVFEALFRQSGASSDVVPIVDVEGPVLRQLLAYLYNQQAPELSSSLTRQLLAAAQKYRVLGLMNECEKQVAAQLSVETAAATAFIAVKYGCPRLEEAAISFIKANTHQVMATKGWEDALRCQPRVAVQVTRLLSEPPAESSVPAAPDGLPTASAQQHQHQSQPHGRTPVTAVPPMSLHHTPPPGDDAASHLRSLSAEEKAQSLIEAAMEGAVEHVEALLAAGADVGARDEGSTALYMAAYYGHVQVAKRLMGAGAEVDARNSSQCTPLHCAAQQGHAAVVRLLLASSADIDARSEGSWTALHWAAYGGHAEAAAVLLRAGADRGAETDTGHTPLDLARIQEDQQLIDMLT